VGFEAVNNTLMFRVFLVWMSRVTMKDIADLETVENLDSQFETK